MEVCVPDEPPSDTKEKVCTLRLRYPNGSQATRRFLASHLLQVTIHSSTHSLFKDCPF